MSTHDDETLATDRENAALVSLPPALSAGTLALLARFNVPIDKLFLIESCEDADLDKLDALESAAMTPIPSGLPSIGPATLTQLRRGGVATAFDVIKPTRPSVEGVGPARWAVLEDWAERQAPDRARLDAAKPLRAARHAFKEMEKARNVRRTYKNRSDLFWSQQITYEQSLEAESEASNARDSAMWACQSAARLGIAEPLVDFIEWDTKARREDLAEANEQKARAAAEVVLRRRLWIAAGVAAALLLSGLGVHFFHQAPPAAQLPPSTAQIEPPDVSPGEPSAAATAAPLSSPTPVPVQHRRHHRRH